MLGGQPRVVCLSGERPQAWTGEGRKKGRGRERREVREGLSVHHVESDLSGTLGPLS